jgi:bifunctional DNA-binding transcriptional regulator/antitoxin component of YhaV-PrlF toxin-antitoxin module
MEALSTTKLSSKGQVVIPEEFGKLLSKVHNEAKKADVKKDNIAAAIKKVRLTR